MAKSNPNDALSLSSEQKNALHSAKAWWQEGERRLDYLGERAQYQNVLEQAAHARDRFRALNSPVGTDAVPILRLARAFAPNVAVNRTRETDAFARALHALLFGDALLGERLSDFLQTVRGVGALTASQLLFTAYPDRYPFVTREAMGFLSATSEQKRAARLLAQERYGETGDVQTTSLLTRFVLLDTARNAMSLPDFADFDAVLRHAREMPKGTTRRKRGTLANAVRESEEAYGVAPNPDATEAGLLRYLEAFAASQGLTYPPLAIRNYYLCHKTKPFVILAGLSGTGKTRLTELFAEGITGNPRSRYRLLPVRPDWSDPSPLLGYHNALTGNYIGTPFLDLLKEAGRAENRDRSYFVCLDEMNLARAEHYLADVLSAMEARGREIPLAGTFDAVTLPRNLFLSGTVNVEEGTHPFGLKVLDRANVIEFGEVRFQQTTTQATSPTSLPEIAPGDRERLFLGGGVETVAEAEGRLALVSPRYVERFYECLAGLSDLLIEGGFAFGYRVRDESLRYIAHSFAPDGSTLLIEGGAAEDSFNVALDFQWVQKVLPRIGGTQERLSKLLRVLTDWAEINHFPRTAAKLSRMTRRANEEGIVSFWD
ncbi:MAG: hypothetical protein H8F28_18020 [Fibrella sp.]|nr:hypothetical protein [Armatimonadota bacterium]